MMGYGLAGLFLPIPERNEMKIGDILAKLDGLNEDEKQAVRLWGNQSQAVNAFVGGLQNGGSDVFANTLNSNTLPFSKIYSEVLSVAKTTITVPIPSGFTHLLIMGSGRMSQAVNTTQTVNIEINGDTGNNYNLQYLNSADTVVGADDVLASIYFGLGDFVGDSATAGKVGSFTCFIPHYMGGLHKSGMSLFIAPSNTVYRAGVVANFWNNTDPIRSVKFWVTGNYDIVAGSVLSIHGIR